MKLVQESNTVLDVNAENGEVVSFNQTEGFIGTLEVPTVANLVDIKRIGDYALKGLNARHVVLYEGIESLGSGFLEDSEVTSLVWANSIEKVAEDALAGSKVTELSVPHPLTVVGTQMMFADNGRLYYLEDLFMEIIRKVFPKSEGSFKGVNRSEEYDGYGDMFFSFTISGEQGDFIPVEEGDTFSTSVDYLAKTLVRVMSLAYSIITNSTDINLGDHLSLEEVDSRGLDYDLENGFVTGFKDGAKLPLDLVLPASIGGIIMTGVTAAAFRGIKFESLHMPNTYHDLGDEAFKDCGIKDLTISGNIELVGKDVFVGNNIKYINLPFANEIEKGTQPFKEEFLLGGIRKMIMEEIPKSFNGCVFNYKVVETNEIEMHESEVDNPSQTIIYSHYVQIDVPNNKLEKSSKDIAYDVAVAGNRVSSICFQLASNKAHEMMMSQK